MPFNYTVAERFLRYVQIDTQADPNSTTAPSTEKQKNLSRLLVDELKAMGAHAVEMSEQGVVYATIQSNSDKKNIPTVCFCAHVDTAPDASGTNVKPIVHKKYLGQDIVLPDDTTQIIRLFDYPYLNELIGEDIITASGLTLLGSDDKSGVAEIMDAAYQLINNKKIKHGDIKLLFTTDEEVGRGADNIDYKKLGADVAYTLDGGEAGTLENETFSADAAILKINGVASHPGYAKGKMENAAKILGHIVSGLPRNRLAPEVTDKKKGFIHTVHIEGGLEQASANFILRSFKTAELKEIAQILEDGIKKVMRKFPNSTYTLEIKEQYRNMKEVLDKQPEIVEYAMQAITRAGLKPKLGSIRGGTDGSRMSFMGLPCPNLFAGEQAIHSRHEFVSIQDMQRAVDTIVHLCQIWEERSN